jgi:hypothetical protein
MGDERIFLKSIRDASFNTDLSNEPNFDQIHLAGQWTVPLKTGAEALERPLDRFRLNQVKLL